MTTARFISDELFDVILQKISQEELQQLEQNDASLVSIDIQNKSEKQLRAAQIRYFTHTNTELFFHRALPEPAARNCQSESGQRVEPKAFLRALENNYYLTNFKSNADAFDLMVVEICTKRNYYLKVINFAIRRALSILETYDGEKQERVDSLRILARINEHFDRKLLPDGQAALLDWFILAMIDFHFAKFENVFAMGQCVLVSLKVLIKSLAINYDALPQDFFLKEYVRLLEGKGFALNFESKAAQWSALACLLQPFKHVDLQEKANQLVTGLLFVGVVNDCQDREVRRAVDWLLLFSWVTNSKEGDRPIAELNAYARLIDVIDPTLTEKFELSRDYHQCVAEFKALIESEMADKGFSSYAQLGMQCCETIVKKALTMQQIAPATLFQPDPSPTAKNTITTPPQSPNHHP